MRYLAWFLIPLIIDSANSQATIPLHTCPSKYRLPCASEHASNLAKSVAASIASFNSISQLTTLTSNLKQGLAPADTANGFYPAIFSTERGGSIEYVHFGTSTGSSLQILQNLYNNATTSSTGWAKYACCQHQDLSTGISAVANATSTALGKSYFVSVAYGTAKTNLPKWPGCTSESFTACSRWNAGQFLGEVQAKTYLAKLPRLVYSENSIEEVTDVALAFYPRGATKVSQNLFTNDKIPLSVAQTALSKGWYKYKVGNNSYRLYSVPGVRDAPLMTAIIRDVQASRLPPVVCDGPNRLGPCSFDSVLREVTDMQKFMVSISKGATSINETQIRTWLKSWQDQFHPTPPPSANGTNATSTASPQAAAPWEYFFHNATKMFVLKERTFADSNLPIPPLPAQPSSSWFIFASNRVAYGVSVGGWRIFVPLQGVDLAQLANDACASPVFNKPCNLAVIGQMIVNLRGQILAAKDSAQFNKILMNVTNGWYDAGLFKIQVWNENGSRIATSDTNATNYNGSAVNDPYLREKLLMFDANDYGWEIDDVNGAVTTRYQLMPVSYSGQMYFLTVGYSTAAAPVDIPSLPTCSSNNLVNKACPSGVQTQCTNNGGCTGGKICCNSFCGQICGVAGGSSTGGGSNPGLTSGQLTAAIVVPIIGICLICCIAVLVMRYRNDQKSQQVAVPDSGVSYNPEPTANPHGQAQASGVQLANQPAHRGTLNEGEGVMTGTGDVVGYRPAQQATGKFSADV